MIEFYDNDMSSCAQKVRLVLVEKNLPFERHYLNLRAGDQFRPEYLKLNPNAVVPTIVDDGRAVIESSVIIEYLDDAYPQPPLRPETPYERALMRQWIIRADAGLHDACGVTSFALVFRHQLAHLDAEGKAAFFAKIPSEKRRTHVRNMTELGLDAPGVGEALRLYYKTVRDMAARLEQSHWLAGDAYSLADVAMIPYVLRLQHLRLHWFWEDLPAVAQWMKRASARPNYSAITDYLDENYLTLMDATPADDHVRVRKILSTE